MPGSADGGIIGGEIVRNPQVPSDRQGTVAPLREGRVCKGGLNRGPSQIKTRPPAPGAIPPGPSAVSTDRMARGAPGTPNRSS